MTETAGRVQLVRDGTLARLGPAGDIDGVGGTAPDGLFAHDARHLSRWQLRVAGAAPVTLRPAEEDPGGASSVSVLTPPGTREAPPAYTVFRDQSVTGGSLTERLTFVSNLPEPVTAELELTADADFADLFELRADRRTYERQGAEHSARPVHGGVRFDHRRDDWHARTVVECAPAPDSVRETPDGGTARTLRWRLSLEPHGRAELRLIVHARPHAPVPPVPRERARARQTPGPGASDLDRAFDQGMTDLDLLTVHAVGVDGEDLAVPAAGSPWFLTLFGRDSLLTSHFLLPYAPETAAATLSALAATQGRTYDAFRGEQPGRIVHEVRKGELAHFRQIPYGRYYGTVDATPLFLVLLHAHQETTGDRTLAARLEQHARRAVDWMLTDGGLQERGYLVYTPDPGGLLNQNWKDSPGSICFADGTVAEGPLAVSEVQGYAYDALLRTARLARDVWDDEDYARRLDDLAAGLRERFLRDFWMPGAGFPALALDGAGRQADALGSDAGHLLWSGILDEERARVTGRRLLQPDFFSGWAVRTLASGQTPYHPLSYHRGSAWPHDNALIALGLARYGLGDEVRALADGLAAAAARCGYRLPEVFAGYGRTDAPAPVPYPHSCSPQAWAAATPAALRTALGQV
ncbi:glycogen debranching N-terminal domain-containing protein [Streptomyces sp. SMS_SU21]|uniref:amylo-alpha-1,6-glucosidase n=1 Tax=Streptomyces sp. SMS_SU21 TaxID=2069440 RepID=UPI000C88BF03|nr:glycogen debranching N-terminal domain-containing protein [Streptomyces sp. SMS_SU21]MCA2202312.1 aminotransferase [Streptomyces sp. SMS_SU21]